MNGNLPIEVQQLDPLHSASLSPFFDALVRAIYAGTAGQNWGETLRNFWLLLPDYAVSVMLKLFSFSFLLSLILIVFVIITANNLMRVRQEMHDALGLPGQVEADEAETLPPIINEKWQNVLVHINSGNPSDWKLAILECDIMLSDILEKMGYLQESISEKLKSVEPSDFTNIENAWEAHKIRNQIAHEGSDFIINEREAKRVIGLYETVFREFEYI
jgi:hypothetical protein